MCLQTGQLGAMQGRSAPGSRARQRCLDGVKLRRSLTVSLPRRRELHLLRHRALPQRRALLLGLAQRLAEGGRLAVLAAAQHLLLVQLRAQLLHRARRLLDAAARLALHARLRAGRVSRPARGAWKVAIADRLLSRRAWLRVVVQGRRTSR